VIAEALRECLAEKRSDDVSRTATVERYLDDEIDFDHLAATIGRRDAGAVRRSKQLIDRGEAVVDDLTER